VRDLIAAGGGRTAVGLRAGILARAPDCTVDLLLSIRAEPAENALRYDRREDFEQGLRTWIAANPDGVVVMAAAVNDFALDSVATEQGGAATVLAPGAKIPSKADALVIRLKPASKIIDQLAGWGLRGPVVGFKFEDGATVVASAEALRRRSGAVLVVANSLDMRVQALVDGAGVERFADRHALIAALAGRLVGLAAR
jgi:hypothetical protein